MAGTLLTTDILELESQRKGYTGISLTHWTDALEPEIALGSVLEIAGALIEFQANEDMDVAGAWGGIAANTLVYGYVNGATLVPALTTTAPTWNTELQGYYDATNQHRYFCAIWKNTTGGYSLKKILKSRDIIEVYKNQDYEKIIQLQYRGADALLTEDSWTKLTLDTTSMMSIPGASLAASVITLPAGYYCIDNLSVLFKITVTGTIDLVKMELRVNNTTDGIIIGGCNYTSIAYAVGSEYKTSGTFQKQYFSIASSKSIEVQYYLTDSSNASAFYSVGTLNSYYPTGILIKKISEIE